MNLLLILIGYVIAVTLLLEIAFFAFIKRRKHGKNKNYVYRIQGEHPDKGRYSFPETIR